MRVTDGDGDAEDGIITVEVEDGTPTAAIALATASVIIDETAGDDALSDDTLGAGNNPVGTPFAGLPGTPIEIAQETLPLVDTSGSIYGVNGAGTTVLTLDVASSGVDSGLDTTDGRSIFLFKEGSLVIGRAETSVGSGENPSGAIAFAVAMSASGVVSVAQYLAIKHDDAGDPDENNDNGSNTFDAAPDDVTDPVQQTIAAGAIVARVVVTDSDGDVSNATVSIGGAIAFEDDGPSIDVTAGADTGVVLTTQDAETIGAATDVATSAAAFGSVFAQTFGYGADGAGVAPVLSYALTLSVVDGSDSGLDSNGAQINLFNVGGTIYGSTTNLLGSAVANAVFSIAVSATGVVTLTQHSEIDHAPEVPSGSPFDDQFAVLGTGLVRLTASATITDGDGDTATDSEFIDLGGNIRFGDDGPSALVGLNINATVTLDETIGGGDTPNDDNVAGNSFPGSYGTPIGRVRQRGRGVRRRLHLRRGRCGHQGLHAHHRRRRQHQRCQLRLRDHQRQSHLPVHGRRRDRRPRRHECAGSERSRCGGVRDQDRPRYRHCRGGAVQADRPRQRLRGGIRPDRCG